MSATRAAFDELVAQHQGAVLRICRSILRDDHLGADAAQETFLRLWRRIAEGRAPRAHGAWLRRTAVSASLDLARRRAVRDEAARGLLDAAGPESVVDDQGPDERAALAELEHRLETAVDRLPEGQRTVFLLRHSGGLALPEVAAALGIALPTVKTQFARACLKLQSALSNDSDPSVDSKEREPDR